MSQLRRLLEHVLLPSGDALPSLSALEATILELLGSDEKFGLQLVAESQGTLKRGSIYVTLGRMVDKGLVESRPEPQKPGAVGLPRRYYRATPTGLATLRTWQRAARVLAQEARA